MSRQAFTKDCPACRLTAHLGRCKVCGDNRTIPLCPPVGDVVVICFEDGECYPLLVMKSERRGEPVRVYVSGTVHSMSKDPVPYTNVPGPSESPGHWHWKESPE